jgi:molybdate transport system regulatory protein
MPKTIKDEDQIICIGESKEINNFKLKGKIWLETKDRTLLGFGRILLLLNIQKYGSISKAAKAMNMSYKRAWDIVDSINKQMGRPIVISRKGGKGGGGTQLSPEGEKIVNQFLSIYEKFNQFLTEELKNFTKVLSLKE